MLPPIGRVLTGVFILNGAAGAAELPRATAILEENCLKCHNAVRQDERAFPRSLQADARKGGLHGPAIVAGKAGREHRSSG